VRTLVLGPFLGYEHEDVDETTFGSTLSALDYDLVILNLEEGLQGYGRTYGGTYMGMPCLDDDDSFHLRDDFARRASAG
jgi:hypothetical protein